MDGGFFGFWHVLHCSILVAVDFGRRDELRTVLTSRDGL